VDLSHRRIVLLTLSRARGATSIEYALVASLIALVVIVGVALVGTSVESVYARVASCFANPASCIARS